MARKGGSLDRYELAAVLNDVGNFAMGSFRGRLTLQKTVHLLQSFGLGLGYRFAWYRHGPYCPTLTRDGFAAGGIAPAMPHIPIEFETAEMQRRHVEFKEFLADKKHDPEMLEIASSICYLDGAGMGKDEVLKIVEDKKHRFKAGQCRRAWSELAGYGVAGSRNVQ